MKYNARRQKKRIPSAWDGSAMVSSPTMTFDLRIDQLNPDIPAD